MTNPLQVFYIPLVFLTVFIIYVLLYQYCVHYRKYRHVPTTEILSPPRLSRRVGGGRIPREPARTLFNPSCSINPRGGITTVTRYTPGHHRTAGMAFLYLGSEDDLDRDRGFDVAGKRFLPRASFASEGSETTELLYVPVNQYRWQVESPIHKQGEDIRLIRGEDNKLLGMGVLPAGNQGSRLALGEFSRDVVGNRLCWVPTMLLNAPGERDKNWTLIRREKSLFFLTHAFPLWRVVEVDYEKKSLRGWMERDTSDVIGKMDIRISNFGTGDCCQAIHLGGGEVADFRQGTGILAFHTHRPYRTLFCEIDLQTLLPRRLSFPVSLRNRPEGAPYIELVTSVSPWGADDLLLGVGVDDTFGEIIVHRKSTIEGVLKINVDR